MDLEVTIAERLQKLKQWQIEQQERLLKQQQIQRESLSYEQDRIYKAFGLSIYNDLDNIVESTKDASITCQALVDTKQIVSKDLSLRYNAKNSDNALTISEGEIQKTNIGLLKDCKREENENSNHILTTIDRSINPQKKLDSEILLPKAELNTDVLMEEKLSFDNVVSNKHVPIDDIPIPSSKKDFQTLLEEKLKRESEVISIDSKNQTKKPFLKKGQGLSRFKSLSANSNSLTAANRYTAPLSLDIQCTDKMNKNNKSIIHKDTVAATSINVPITNAARVLNLKTVPFPKKKNCSKFESTTPAEVTTFNTISDRSKFLSERNILDFDSKTERELEETRIFELLEEKAENSSFCSTSSTVVAFLQQSTPFKMKKGLSCIANGVTNTKEQSNKQTSDVIQGFAEIENSKQDMQRRSDQFHVHKCSRSSNTNNDSHWDTVNDVETGIQRYSITANQISQSKEIHIDHLEDDDISYNLHTVTVLSSDSDEEKDIFTGNHNPAYDGESDTNHRVRFSEYNEYKSIDLAHDISNVSNKSTFINNLKQDWDSCSISTSKSFGMEESSPLDREMQVSSPQTMDNETIFNASIQLPLRHNITDSHYQIVRMVSIPDEEHAPSSKGYCRKSTSEDIYDDNECVSILDETIQTDRCFKQSVFSSLSTIDSHRHPSAHKEKEYLQRSVSNKATEVDTNMQKAEHPSFEDRENRMNSFETELLKTRLLELEKEINIFRKESISLLFQRQRLQEDRTMLRKEYTEKERYFEENKRRIQNELQEEKKRLAREKIAMENRIRDAYEKARQNKIEKQKMQNLQEQLEKLRDELNVRESRWNAAESRYKSELRTLRVKVSKLKQEIACLQNAKKTNIKKIRNVGSQLNTKAINQINKRIVSSKEIFTETSRVLPATSDISIHHEYDENKDIDNDHKCKSIEPIVKKIDTNDDLEQIKDSLSMNKKESKQTAFGTQSKCDQQNSAKKRDLYENLLKDAISDLVENQKHPSYIMQNARPQFYNSIITQNAESNEIFGENNNHSCSNLTNEDSENATVYNNTGYYTDGSRKTSEDGDKGDIMAEDQEFSSEKKCSMLFISSDGQTSGKSIPGIVKQIQHPDGRIEYWYPNGNVKKIFPAQGATKMIYYNGDVRETDKDGGVKYFYATTRTWHTTTLNGLEILEFPDGQVEKRSSDGTIEVSFPDGALRIAQADGTDKWTLPDGTMVQTFANGDKILALPSGQREIHTKAHKRREYPDGTVKLVYADGTQETRYSSGRKRLKDKDGNLLMDSYDG